MSFFTCVASNFWIVSLAMRKKLTIFNKSNSKCCVLINYKMFLNVYFQTQGLRSFHSGVKCIHGKAGFHSSSYTLQQWIHQNQMEWIGDWNKIFNHYLETYFVPRWIWLSVVKGISFGLVVRGVVGLRNERSHFCYL